jgi:hypothetical protein
VDEIDDGEVISACRGELDRFSPRESMTGRTKQVHSDRSHRSLAQQTCPSHSLGPPDPLPACAPYSPGCPEPDEGAGGCREERDAGRRALVQHEQPRERGHIRPSKKQEQPDEQGHSGQGHWQNDGDLSRRGEEGQLVQIGGTNEREEYAKPPRLAAFTVYTGWPTRTDLRNGIDR